MDEPLEQERDGQDSGNKTTTGATKLNSKLWKGKKCTRCDSKATNQCSQCHTPYCSRKRQAEDWRDKHRGECRLIKQKFEEDEEKRKISEAAEEHKAATERKETPAWRNICGVCLEQLPLWGEMAMTYYTCCNSSLCSVLGSAMLFA